MDKLFDKVKELEQSDIGKVVRKRLSEFSAFRHKDNKEWFSELCFCLLTANSKAKTASDIQEELGSKGFCESSAEQIMSCIQRHGHRFHNNKTAFIVGARRFVNIKDVVGQQISVGGISCAREWLVSNIKGLGYKEASHFLRNVGFFDVAIVDRHILKVLAEYGYIEEIPKNITHKKYMELEDLLRNIAEKTDMNMAELDLYMWYMKSGFVLK